MNTSNRNMLWASVFVDELIRAGVRAACIAPGSRSTPLAFAFAERPEIKSYSLLDERGAAFFGLGLGLAGDGPAALVCTSGTAAANFLPAIIEASQSEIPLLVLSADRPAELRGSGANQTIDQVKLFGVYPRWFVEMPMPEANPPPHLLAALRTTADRAVAIALGLNGAAGPVHLNFPFRKPLEPTPRPQDLSPEWRAAGALDPALNGRTRGAAYVQIGSATRSATQEQIEALAGQIQGRSRGLIVCGPRCAGSGFTQAVLQLAGLSGYPILADSLSGLRFGAHAGTAPVLAGYETFLACGSWRENLPQPGLVLRFGDLPISAALGSYLAALPAAVEQIAIGASERWADDMFVLSGSLQADPIETCRRLSRQVVRHDDPDFMDAWRRAESAAWQAVNEFRAAGSFEGAVLAELVEHLPDGARLYVANSLPIRHLDQFAAPRAAGLQILANRGASGIDGTISSALGAAAGSGGPLVLVSGDLSFYHDLNGLIAFKRCGVNATIVLIHNDGGGVFQRLPAAHFDPAFTDLVLTPHGLDFAPAAGLFGVDYRLLARLELLGPALDESIGDAQPHILAIRTDAVDGERVRQEIIARAGELYERE